MMPGYESEGIDLGTLLDALAGDLPGDLSTKASAALTNYNELVTYFVKDVLMREGTGLSIYWPNPSYFYKGSYDSLDIAQVWAPLLSGG